MNKSPIKASGNRCLFCYIGKVLKMDNAEKYELLNELYYKLDIVKAELKRSPANVKLRIKKDKLRQEIKELKMTMTTEEFEQLLSEKSEINVDKCQ